MEDPKKKPIRQATSIYRRDFLSTVEVLKMRCRFGLERHKTGKPPSESKEQLSWALQELDRIKLHYERKMPWPAGGFTFAVKDTWPADSDLREDLMKIEKEYYAQITKPPR